jgi:hypothetical protein
MIDPVFADTKFHRRIDRFQRHQDDSAESSSPGSCPLHDGPLRNSLHAKGHSPKQPADFGLPLFASAQLPGMR